MRFAYRHSVGRASVRLPLVEISRWSCREPGAVPAVSNHRRGRVVARLGACRLEGLPGTRPPEPRLENTAEPGLVVRSPILDCTRCSIPLCEFASDGARVARHYEVGATIGRIDLRGCVLAIDHAIQRRIPGLLNFAPLGLHRVQLIAMPDLTCTEILGDGPYPVADVVTLQVK